LRKKATVDRRDQKQTSQRDKHLSDAEQHYSKMAPLEALLESDEVIEKERLTEIRKEHSSLKVPYDASKHRA